MREEEGKTIKMSGMYLLPPKPGVCQVCATEHGERLPHNLQSLYYQYRFYAEHGRWPTWEDAMAHCNDEVRKATIDVLKEKGLWKDG